MARLGTRGVQPTYAWASAGPLRRSSGPMRSPKRRITAEVNKKLTSLLFGNEGGDAMDDTGMTEADKIGLVEDVLGIWGEDAAREIADRYGVNLEALGQEATTSS